MLELPTIGFCEQCKEDRTVTPPRRLVRGPDGERLCGLCDSRIRFERAVEQTESLFTDLLTSILSRRFNEELHREAIITGHERAVAVEEAIEE